MTVNNHDWGDIEGPDFELWGEVFTSVARWMCQERAYPEAEPPDGHIANPASDNTPCDDCFDEAVWLVNKSGLGQIVAIYGSVAYAAGRDGLPEDQAATRALQAMVACSQRIERATVLLANADKDGWWQLPPEHGERSLPRGDE